MSYPRGTWFVTLRSWRRRTMPCVRWEEGRNGASANLTTKSQRQCKMQNSSERWSERGEARCGREELLLLRMRIPRCVAIKVEVECSLANLSSSCARVLPPPLPRLRPAALALHAGVREAEQKGGTDWLGPGLAPSSQPVSREIYSALLHNRENSAMADLSIDKRSNQFIFCAWYKKRWQI